MGHTGKTVGTVGGAAIGTAVGGPVGTVIGGALGGLVGGLFDSDDAPPQIDGVTIQRTDYGGAGAQGESDRALSDAKLRAAQAQGQGDTNLQMSLGLGQRDYNAGQALASDNDQAAWRNQHIAAAGAASAANQSYKSADLQGQMLNNSGSALVDQTRSRNMQLNNVGALNDFAQQGPGPSAAEAQMRAGADANMGQAIALARSGRGAGDNATAMRQAMFQNAAAGQQLNQQTGTLRAQEAANWRGQQLNALQAQQGAIGNIRNQDLGLSAQNQNVALGYGNQALNYSQLGQGYTGMGMQNEVAQQGLASQNVGMGMRQQQGYAGMGMSNQLGSTQLADQQATAGEAQRQSILGQNYQGDLSTNQSQAAFDLDKQKTNAGIASNVQLGMAAVNQKQDAANMAMVGSMAAGAVNAMGSGGGGGGGGGGGDSGYGAVGPDGYTSDIRAKKDIRPAEVAPTLADVFGAGDDETTRLSPERERDFQAWAKRMNIRDLDHPDSHYDYRGAYTEGMRPGPDAHWKDTYKQHGHPTFSVESKYSKNAFDGGSWDGDTYIPSSPRPTYNAGALDSAYARQASPAPAIDLRPASAYQYQYRDPAKDGAGTFVGPMAQDLERTPVGRSVVETAPNGKKKVDAGRLTMVNTAALSEQQKRMDELNNRVSDYERRLAQLTGGE